MTVAFNRVAADNRDVTLRTGSELTKNCEKLSAVGCVILRLAPRPEFLTLEDETARLSQNVGKELPLHAV
jgi:hypothetical protein